MTLVDLLSAIVLLYVGARLVEATRLSWHRRDETTVMLRGVRLHHAAVALGVLAAVVVAAGVLVELPGLSWGWWSALGGEGNPVFGATDATSGTVLEWLVPLVFGGLLLVGMPVLVEREEQIFRWGAEQRSPGRNAARAVLFGLAHAVIGIPVGVALALSLGGFAFTAVYLRAYRATGDAREALRESTRVHLVYNCVIIGLIVALMLAWLAGAPV